MDPDNDLDRFLNPIKGQWGIKEPPSGHRERFSERLKNLQQGPKVAPRIGTWRHWGIAASVALCCASAIMFLGKDTSLEARVADISPEASNTRVYFNGLLEEQVRLLQSERHPETEKIVDDAMVQLKILEAGYGQLARDLVDGGNPQMILSAMITNFQTRIDLLQDVMRQIETVRRQREEQAADPQVF